MCLKPTLTRHARRANSSHSIFYTRLLKIFKQTSDDGCNFYIKRQAVFLISIDEQCFSSKSISIKSAE